MPERVSTLELFFDLVFVLIVGQLTAVLAHDPDLEHLARVAVVLALVWWMYGGYAWLTNAVATEGTPRRLALLGGMAGFLVVALLVPTAFEPRVRARARLPRRGGDPRRHVQPRRSAARSKLLRRLARQFQRRPKRGRQRSSVDLRRSANVAPPG